MFRIIYQLLQPEVYIIQSNAQPRQVVNTAASTYECCWRSWDLGLPGNTPPGLRAVCSFPP